MVKKKNIFISKIKNFAFLLAQKIPLLGIWTNKSSVVLHEQIDSVHVSNHSQNNKNFTEKNKEIPFTVEEARIFMKKMESSAILDPQISLTPETWIDTFGLNNSLITPIGNVKMGEGQYKKFFDKSRSSEFGMAVATLKDPDIVLIVPSKAKEGQVTERPYSYIFTKTFDRNGEKVKYYASVTVQRENMEVSVSSHYMKQKRVFERLISLERVYTKAALLPISSEWHLAEQHNAVPDLLPTQGNNATSECKYTEFFENKKIKEEKSNIFEENSQTTISKQSIVEAIIERTTDPSAKAFTAEQQQVILDFLKSFDTTDKKLQALSPLWERADSDLEMSSFPDEWKQDVKEELNDLASGIVRENSRGRTP